MQPRISPELCCAADFPITSAMETPRPGTISWTDLTVPNATAVRDFYAAVAGWSVMPIDMEGYEDFCMMPPGSDQPAAGICHARGPNADLPPQWLIYITVPDVPASVRLFVENGGKVIREPKEMGGGLMAVTKTPPAPSPPCISPAMTPLKTTVASPDPLDHRARLTGSGQ